MFKTVLLSSLEFVYPDSCPKAFEGELEAFANEPLSFQLAYMNEELSDHVNVTVESELPINMYYVANVVVDSYHKNITDKSRHICPDMLMPVDYKAKIVNHKYPWGNYYLQEGNDVQLCAYNDAWSALWFSVNEEGKKIKSGKYPITVRFYDRDNKLIHEFKTSVKILTNVLPKQKLPVTNWFHCDCLADYYHEELFSDRFFEIMGDYLKKAAINGMNMVLVPAFTPPLDIGIGKKRKKAQLVKVTANGNKYDFDFSLFERYIDVAKKSGITYFEHSHLFSQWGAKHAPAIYADVAGRDGKTTEKQIFGWQTDSSKKKYLSFVKQYMAAFRKFAEEKKIVSKTLIHISDEPLTNIGDYYERAYDAIKDSLSGFMQGDALSEYSYYERGYVQIPIAVTSEIEHFHGKCKHLWCYYTGDQTGDGYSNRVYGYESERNRALGYQMFKYNIEGFLNWGYNYWYNVMSQGIWDPKCHTNTFDVSPGGGFIVYPSNNGGAIQSIRQKVFGEGILDFRALKLLEKKKGRDVCDKLLKKHFGEVTFTTLPNSPKAMLDFRAELNKLIEN